MNEQKTYNKALDNGATHAQAAQAVEAADLAPNYHACWHNEAGDLRQWLSSRCRPKVRHRHSRPPSGPRPH